MNKPLGYLREILSNYTDRSDTAEGIYKRIEKYDYETEISFVRTLSEKEVSFLNDILKEEIEHANEEQDEKRSHELNEVYELLI